MTEYATLRVDTTPSGVTTITLNRPDQRNAMNPTMHEEMTDLLDRVRSSEDTRVVVITGAGEAFCAGMDLKEYFLGLRDKPAEYDRITRLAVEWRARTLKLMPQPTIAMINGYCFGGAFSIVEGCDLAFAAEHATFGLSEINFRMFPGGSVSKSLANLLRPRDALYLGLTGRPFDGARAAAIGLLNEAVPKEDLREHVMTLAEELATKDRQALHGTKEGFYQSLDMSWDAAISFSRAREFELTFKQGDAWREDSLRAFERRDFRPGLGDQTSASSDEERA